MAHRPGGHQRAPRWRWPAVSWPGVRPGGRLALKIGGAATLFIAVAVAVAVGVSQATAAPACAPAMGPARALTILAATTRAATTRAATTPASGEATHYVLQPGQGNCSYPGLPAGQLYVALSPGEYGSAAACGSYLKVTGPGGSVTAEVIDQCPPCQAGHIDLSEQAFAQIAPLSAGLVRVTYQTVTDPPLPSPVSVLVKPGSSAYWLALLPIGNGNPLASVQASSPSHGWQELARASYNYWLAPAGMGPGPFTVRLTDSAGHQATLTGITLSPGVVQATGTSMYGPGAVPVAAPLASPSAKASPAARPGHRRGRARRSASPAASRPPAVRPTARSVAAAAPTPSCRT